MYLEHFGLCAEPFDAVSGVNAWFPAVGHVHAIDEIRSSLLERRGLALLVGPRGSGKTTCLRILADEAGDFPLVLAHAPGPIDRPAGLYVPLLNALDGGPTGGPVDALRATLVDRLTRHPAGARSAALVIDNADRLPRPVLEEITVLADLEPTLQIVLAVEGDAVTEPELAGLDPERIHVRCALLPLLEDECASYLRWRTDRAGAIGVPIFDPRAIVALTTRSSGWPGSVNDLAHRALLAAYGKGRDRVDLECVEHGARLVVDAGARLDIAAVATSVPSPGRGDAAGPATVTRLESRIRQPSRSNETEETRATVIGVATGTTDAVATTPAPTSRGPTSPQLPISPSVATPASVAVPTPSTWGDVDARSPSAPGTAPSGIGAVDAGGEPRSGPGARVPDHPILTPAMLPVLSDPHGVAAEWFRILRLRVERWIERAGGGPRCLVITSAEAGAGKTMVATNLALLFAGSTRTLLVDGDLRRPQVQRLFDIPGCPGFADAIAGRADPGSIVQYVSEVGLSVLPAGRPGNPRDLLAPDRLAPVLDGLRESHDVVVIDSPPLDPMVDTRSLSAVADGVLLVIRAGRSRNPAIARTLRALSSATLIGAVVTEAIVPTERAYAEYRRGARR